MTATYIAASRAKPGKTAEYRDFLINTLGAYVSALPDCLAFRVLQAVNDPDAFVLIEEWTSAEAHRASVMTGPPELAGADRFMAGPPSGGFYV